MNPTSAEWLALILSSGLRHIHDDFVNDGYRPPVIPAEVRATVDALIRLAQSDKSARVATLHESATPADTDPEARGLLHVLDAAAAIPCDRRTLERRIKSRGVSTEKIGGRTYVREKDLEKLK